MKRTAIIITCAALALGACNPEHERAERAAEAASTEGTKFTHLGEVEHCQMFKVETQSRVFYVASNSGHHGACAIVADPGVNIPPDAP